MKYLRLLQTLGVSLQAEARSGPAEAFGGLNGNLENHPVMKDLESRRHDLNELIKQVNENIELFRSSLDDAAKKRIEKQKASGYQDSIDPEIEALAKQKKELSDKLEKQQ